MTLSDSSRGRRVLTAVLNAALPSLAAPARSPVFNVFRSSRAVPATPEERLGASTEHLPEACCLRQIIRGSASPVPYGATSGFAVRYSPRLRNRRPAGRRYAGPASAGRLTTSRRGPRYPIAQRLIGVGSFHPTRNTPLSRRTIMRVRGQGIGVRSVFPVPLVPSEP